MGAPSTFAACRTHRMRSPHTTSCIPHTAPHAFPTEYLEHTAEQRVVVSHRAELVPVLPGVGQLVWLCHTSRHRSSCRRVLHADIACCAVGAFLVIRLCTEGDRRPDCHGGQTRERLKHDLCTEVGADRWGCWGEPLSKFRSEEAERNTYSTWPHTCGEVQGYASQRTPAAWHPLARTSLHGRSVTVASSPPSPSFLFAPSHTPPSPTCMPIRTHTQHTRIHACRPRCTCTPARSALSALAVACAGAALPAAQGVRPMQAPAAA